ncbi:probable Mannan endo-1,6-alpha-mannosidase DCW1 [Saccharomycodes ludwigii]|uniref:Mannan endo-1,6-alpha-mannosidase n=1 Tax=Saccharomycodes ludwigii TaxID=36035 RepID=A0A376B131_9ASCO|nr:probable Mannan endo-1,6-alpha-mannosidase DCW1 [Saccharomycodes ludwigii]
MKIYQYFLSLIFLLSCKAWKSSVSAFYFDLDNYTSVVDASELVAQGLMDYYNGLDYGETIGMFTAPYYWWEAGAAWTCMLDYWFILQNDTYNTLINQSLLYQTGEYNNYIPLNQSTTEGNDDQAFWGIAAMTAAERNFTNPPDDEPQWLYLAQAVFNTMALRWDNTTCGGGLRWQIFAWNNGYDYKNSVANGALFHLSARLARYTANNSYVDWSVKVYDWMKSIGLINETWWFVYDGANINGTECETPEYLQWTYNQGLVLAGCAYLYNYTNETLWYNRTMKFLEGSSVFFNSTTGVMYEAACQGAGSCNTDQRSFKSSFARFLGLTAQLVPETSDRILSWLNISAYNVAQSCTGGTDGHTCGLNWFNIGWDGYYGLGEQMSALEVVLNTQILHRPAPYTAFDGGSSKGNGSAGTESHPTNLSPLTIDRGDKAGAGIITAVVGISLIAAGVFFF